MRGKFITFEGSEGCGKSTQAALLVEHLAAAGRRVKLLREPGGVAVSEKIRALLLDPANNAMNRECETLLYMAARAQVVEEAILPELEQGVVLVCDRFLDSTVAYQGYGCGVSVEAIVDIGAFATRGLAPDLTFFLDLDVEEGLRRRGAERDRIEQRPLDYHRRVREGYLAIARRDPARVMLLDGSQSRAELARLIRVRTEALLA